MIKKSFIEEYKKVPMNFALACDEIISLLEIQAKIELVNALLREENAIAAELYTILNSKYQYLNDFYENSADFIVCSGVRVVYEEGSVYVRLRLPLPFPTSFTAIDLELPEFAELKFQLSDLRYRYKSLSMNRELCPALVEKIKSCAAESEDLESFLINARAISSDVAIAVTKMKLGHFDMERRVANSEVVV